MGGAENDPAEQADHVDAGADPPLTVERLANLQAGLLDDQTAARVRKQARADPDAQRTLRALNQVRCDLAALGADSTSAPDAPPAAVAGIAAVLRSADPPVGGSPARGRAAHSARPSSRPARIIAAAAGLAAVAAAVGLGTAALLTAPAPAPSAPTTAQHITVSSPPAVIPLSDAQILDLLDRTPDYGPLSAATHRASCLNGLGYPTSTQVLGAQQIEINGRPGVLLVLPGDTPDKLSAVAVGPTCSAANTGLLASTVVVHP